MKLNAASQYFDGGVFKMNKTNVYYYMSTRNNNFSNREQKGTIVVHPKGVLTTISTDASSAQSSTQLSGNSATSDVSIGSVVRWSSLLVMLMFMVFLL